MVVVLMRGVVLKMQELALSNVAGSFANQNSYQQRAQFHTSTPHFIDLVIMSAESRKEEPELTRICDRLIIMVHHHASSLVHRMRDFRPMCRSSAFIQLTALENAYM